MVVSLAANGIILFFKWFSNVRLHDLFFLEMMFVLHVKTMVGILNYLQIVGPL